MITKVPLQHSTDGRFRESHERALVRIETHASLDKPGVRDLDEVFLVLSAMQELSGELLSQPQMRGDHLIEDLLAPGRPSRLGLDEQCASAFGQLLTSRMLMGRDDRKRGVRHERATLSK
jgi:hypothetical protein